MEPLGAGDPVRVSDFVLRGRLGAGGMGKVFLGRSPGGRAVAVKIVHPHLAVQPKFRRRFQREVTAARAVSGAFTAPVVAAGPEDDPPWIATVYIPGPSLAEAVATAGPLPEDALWPLAAGLVEALQAIHAEGLLHRDLKPSNVLLAADGPRVIDFGIARAMDSTALTGTGTTIGTAGFMSPEQVEDQPVGLAGDVFSLGAVLAFAASGSEPFGQGPPLGILHRVVTGEPRLDGLPDPVRALVIACLAKKPADRPTTAQLLEQIAAHWDAPDDFPFTPLWPEAVTTLIDTHATPATARYTEHVLTPPLLHSAPTITTPQRDAPEPTGRTTGFTEDPARLPQPARPRALRRRRRHALKLGEAGEHAEAARLLAEVVADSARVLGPDHPDTLGNRGNHASELGAAGEHAEAARLFAELAADRARVLGPDHPDTLSARFLHATNLGEAGDHAEAARLLAEVVADRARVLGADHHHALAARRRHAGFVGEAGDHAESARLHAELAADRARVLGADHYDTLLSRHLHAWELGEAGEHAEAARLYAEIAVDSARVLGPDHPDTLSARSFSDRWSE
ncbi:protein kinase domain-containing protein [Streptomyces yatensis]|uniref:Protein kinase domain-containing protein n=1 Tax=Streptomyces yatensis TaxID=155177 RepID=A0ABP4UPC2_9ACTN|nr:protein kinase [Streptomyces yatensis]